VKCFSTVGIPMGTNVPFPGRRVPLSYEIRLHTGVSQETRKQASLVL
jgi:hypothetical protein